MAVENMATALERVAGSGAINLIDPSVLRIVKTWPGRFATTRADALGLRADASFDAVIRDYILKNLVALKLQTSSRS